MGLRVSPEEEEHGLDVHEHGVVAYPDFTPPQFAEVRESVAPSMGVGGR